jgi:hypothetical protein
MGKAKGILAARQLAMHLTMLAAFTAAAQIQVLEPDNYPDGTVLDHILPGVHLTTAGADNLPIPPVPFEVTATDDILDLAPTGTNVFGCANVPFWNTDRRLRLEFTAPVWFVALDFAGGQFFTNETGRLDAYNASGQLIASHVTTPQPAGDVETMSIARAGADIARAIAYVPPDAGVFGRLDRLRIGFGVPPQPPVISGIAPGANGGMVLTFQGQPQFVYRVWASTNLQRWTVLGTATPGLPGTFFFADAGATTNAWRFYRVSLP